MGACLQLQASLQPCVELGLRYASRKRLRIRDLLHAIREPVRSLTAARARALKGRYLPGEGEDAEISFSNAIVQQTTEAMARISMTPFTPGSAFINSSNTGTRSISISNSDCAVIIQARQS